jgi:hypothetical protein
MSLTLLTPTGEIQAALQRAIDLVGFGLQAADVSTPADLTLPGVTGHVTAAADRAMTVEAARAEFRSWVLANGLREGVEAIGPALEWARKTCFIWTRRGSATRKEDGKIQLSATLTGAEWNDGIVAAASKFDRLPLPEKIDTLERQYGMAKVELRDHVLSINAARNCLAHRKGIVGLADLKTPTDRGLVVRWRKMQLSALGADGSLRLLEIPATVEAGETVRISIIDAQKEFALGELVAFTASEFVELCLSLLLFALQIQESINTLQSSRVESPPPTGDAIGANSEGPAPAQPSPPMRRHLSSPRE